MAVRYLTGVLLRVCTYKALCSPVESNGGCRKVVRNNSAECCEFHKKNRPIASEDIIQRGRTCSDCLRLQGLISGGALGYEYYYSSSSCTVVQRCSTSNMYKATQKKHNKLPKLSFNHSIGCTHSRRFALEQTSCGLVSFSLSLSLYFSPFPPP